MKPYSYSTNSISAAYHSEHELSTTNLNLINSPPTSNLTSYVNFNNNPPNDNDVYHIHDTSNSQPIPSIFSTSASSASVASTTPVSPSLSTDYHHNLNGNGYFHTNHHKPTNHHVAVHNFNQFENNDDHRRPHTHGHHNHSGMHSHHHNYENFLHTTANGDKQSTVKPTLHSFINFNQTNLNQHPVANPKPTYKPAGFQFHSTTILPPIVMNYNPFKPANHSSSAFLLSNKNHSSTILATNNRPMNATGSFQSANKPISNGMNTHSSSTWNSFYKPWSSNTNHKPSNG